MKNWRAWALQHRDGWLLGYGYADSQRPVHLSGYVTITFHTRAQARAFLADRVRPGGFWAQVRVVRVEIRVRVMP